MLPDRTRPAERDWPLLTDEARRLRLLIQEAQWRGFNAEPFERDLKSVLRQISEGQSYAVPF